MAIRGAGRSWLRSCGASSMSPITAARIVNRGSARGAIAGASTLSDAALRPESRQAMSDDQMYEVPGPRLRELREAEADAKRMREALGVIAWMTVTEASMERAREIAQKAL